MAVARFGNLDLNLGGEDTEIGVLDELTINEDLVSACSVTIDLRLQPELSVLSVALHGVGLIVVYLQPGWDSHVVAFVGIASDDATLSEIVLIKGRGQVNVVVGTVDEVHITLVFLGSERSIKLDSVQACGQAWISHGHSDGIRLYTVDFLDVAVLVAGLDAELERSISN